MDAATLYAIMTLANGAMKTRVLDLPSDKCELTAAGLRQRGEIAWCRPAQKPLVIAR